MPVLPTYDAQRNIEAQQAAPFRNEAGQNAAIQNKIMGTVQDIAQRWSDANDVMQYTDAKAKYGVAAAEIQSRADADPNFKNSPQYIKELDDARKNSLKVIDNQEVANKASMEFDYNNQITGIKIDAGFKQKQIEFNKVQLKTNLDVLQQKKLSAFTEAEKMQYDHQIENLLQANVDTGVLSYGEAAKALSGAQEDGVKYEIYSDQATNEKDSQVLKDLKDPNGKYSFLPPDVRLKMIEESQRRIFQNNQTYKRIDETAKNERFDNIFAKANDGTLTLQDLDVEEAASKAGVVGALDQKEILDIRRGLQTRIKSDLELITENNEKAAGYLKFVNEFIDDETTRQKGREAIVRAFKDGILSSKEAGFLNSIKRETEDIKFDRQIKNNNMIPFKTAITSLRDWFRGKQTSSEKDAAMAIKKLLTAGADGIAPESATQKILNEDRTTSKPDIKSFPTTGQLMVDPVSGVKAIVYPDGRIEAVN